jgi:hypothetical protein
MLSLLVTVIDARGWERDAFQPAQQLVSRCDIARLSG